MTKKELAQVIATALFNKDTLVDADNWKVVSLAKNNNRDFLVDSFELAVEILKDNGTYDEVVIKNFVNTY